MLSPIFLAKGVVAPAVTAFLTALVLQRVFRGTRGIGAIAFAAGQVVGTLTVLYGSEQGFPTRNLQWVPWIGVLAAAFGPTVVATALTHIERWLLTILIAAVASAVLVPVWPDLWPPRPVSRVALVVATLILHLSLTSLANQAPLRVLTLSMATTALFAALLIMVSYSLSVGEAALTTAAALGGAALAVALRPDVPAIQGICLPYLLAVGGWCYVTAIEPTPAIVPLLFLPAIPLALTLVAVGPLSRWPNRSRMIASFVILAVMFTSFGAWTWFSTEQGDDEYSQAGPLPTTDRPVSERTQHWLPRLTPDSQHLTNLSD